MSEDRPRIATNMDVPIPQDAAVCKGYVTTQILDISAACAIQYPTVVCVWTVGGNDDNTQLTQGRT